MKDALGHGSDPRGGAQAIAEQHSIPTEHLAPPKPYIMKDGSVWRKRGRKTRKKRNLVSETLDE